MTTTTTRPKKKRPPAARPSSALVEQDRQDWRTDRPVFNTLHAEYRYTIDLYASAENTLLPRYFDKEADANRQSWAGERGFGNPEYGRLALAAALDKARRAMLEEGAFSTLLIPAATDRAWFHDEAVRIAEVHLFRGRIRFGDPLGAGRTNPKQANALVIFDPQSTRRGWTASRSAKTGAVLWRAP